MEQEQFSLNCYEQISVQVLRNAKDAAERNLESMTIINNKIEAKSGKILGWIIATITALISAIVIQIQNGISIILIMTIYGLLLFFIVAFVLIKGIHYKQPVYFNGCPPSAYFFESNLSSMLTYDKDSDGQEKFSLTSYIEYLDSACVKTLKINQRWVKAFRSAVKILTIGLFLSLVLLVFLVLFL